MLGKVYEVYIYSSWLWSIFQQLGYVCHSYSLFQLVPIKNN